MNITVDRAVIEQALETLDRRTYGDFLEWASALKDVRDALHTALEQPEQEPVKLRRGDILRCIETDELCTVWATSTTGKTLVKWGANNFGEYTAEQIGELFWLEPEPPDLELAAERSDNYAAFHSGYRFAVAHSSTQPKQEPVAWMLKSGHGTEFNDCIAEELKALTWKGKPMWTPLYIAPPQRKPLSDEEIQALWEKAFDSGLSPRDFARAIEVAHNIKGDA